MAREGTGHLRSSRYSAPLLLDLVRRGRLLERGIGMMRARTPRSRSPARFRYRRARTLADVAPAGFAELCGIEAFRQQIAHHLVGERLHAAIGVMDDEPFAGAEQK
jgi:hypothetical protein